MIDKMILVEDKSKCCGCGACMQICPRNAISMEEDQYGFVYPKIDESKCVKCGACRNICSFQRRLWGIKFTIVKMRTGHIYT